MPVPKAADLIDYLSLTESSVQATYHVYVEASIEPEMGTEFNVYAGPAGATKLVSTVEELGQVPVLLSNPERSPLPWLGQALGRELVSQASLRIREYGARAENVVVAKVSVALRADIVPIPLRQ